MLTVLKEIPMEAKSPNVLNFPLIICNPSISSDGELCACGGVRSTERNRVCNGREMCAVLDLRPQTGIKCSYWIFTYSVHQEVGDDSS